MRQAPVQQDAGFGQPQEGTPIIGTRVEPNMGFPDVPGFEPIGQVRSEFQSFKLYDPSANKLISSISNPIVLWDRSQEVYDCRERLLGSVSDEYDLGRSLSDTYAPHKVYDA